MNKSTLIIRLTLVLLFLLIFLSQHAVLSYTSLDCIEFGNTPLNPYVSIALSDGRYVSLMGKPSRVFSLNGNEISFEQSVFSAELYSSVQKGDGDTLYAVTNYGVLDIYIYTPMDGLLLLSSTDLSDPADDTITRYTTLMLANGVVILENNNTAFDHDTGICRSIIDVSDPLSPLLISRTYLDYEDHYTGFYYLNGHYIYIGLGGALYTSASPAEYPDSIDVPGLEQLNIHYTMLIEDNIYIICSTNLQVFRFAGLDLSNINAPCLSLMHSTQLRHSFGISMDSEDMICVTGMNSANVWQIDKYLYSNQDNWQLLDTASFSEHIYKLFPISGGYFAAGIYSSMILGSQFNIQAIINESPSYFLERLILGRYMVLSERVSSGTTGYRIFDLQTEEFLDFFIDGFLNPFNLLHGTNKIIFKSNIMEIVEFDEGGISRTWSLPPPSLEISKLAIYEDLLALSGYVNGQWRIYIYTLTASGIVFQSERLLPHISANLSFYDENHLFVNRYTETDESFMYFYRIEQDYSLTYLTELTYNGTRTLILDNAIIATALNGSVIDTTDPDNPVIIHTLSLPRYGNWGGSYDGHGHYMLNGYDRAFVLDSDYLPLGYLNGSKLWFYQPGCFLNPGPAGVVKARIDAIVSNDDHLHECILPGSIRNYPNPFNPKTTIEFTVPNDGKVLMTIYNIRGQKVKELLNKQMLAGKLAVSWDGTDAGGRSVGSGLYFALIKQKNTSQIHKMLLMK